MIHPASHPLAVCSWSLMPESPDELRTHLDALGLNRVQLALDPIRTGQWSTKATQAALDGIELVSGMMECVGEDYSTLGSIARTGGVRPSEHWPANRDAALANAELARQLGIDLVTFHAGFVPDDHADPEFAEIVDRIAKIRRAFEDAGVRVALETGQESAAVLDDLLARDRLASIGVNFDPANMLLYGSGDPIKAMTLLKPRITQVHLKDADPSPTPGQWGTEQPAGHGSVDWPRFFDALPPDIAVVIEREGGNDRRADIAAAIELAEQHGCIR